MICSPKRKSVVPALALVSLIFALDAATSQTLIRPRTVTPQQTTPQQPDTPDSTNDAAPPRDFVATAYALRGRTASGQQTRRGIIAADRRVLPMGTRVRLSAGSQSGEYVVADTGGAVRGNKIDIWVPNNGEAIRFGRRNIKLTVLQYPGGNRVAGTGGAARKTPRAARRR